MSSYLFYAAQAHLLRDGTAHSAQDPSVSADNEDNGHRHARSQCDGDTFQWKFPLLEFLPADYGRSVPVALVFQLCQLRTDPKS